MIGIQLDGDMEFLDTYPDTAIQIRLENPIFGDAESLSPGSYSYPFDSPAEDISPKNSALLKNPDVIENNESYAQKKASLFFDGVPFKKGNLISKTDVLGKLSNYFTFGLNSLNGDIKTSRLADVLNFIDDNFNISSSNITNKVYVKRTTNADINVTLNGATYNFPNTQIGVIDLDNATGSAAFTLTLDKPNAWAPKAIPFAGSSPGGILGVPNAAFLVKLVQFYTISPGVYGERDATDPLLPLSVTVDKPEDYQIEADLGTYFRDFQIFLAPYLNESTYPNSKIRFPVAFNANMYDEPLKEGDGINLVDSTGFVRNDPNWGFTHSSPGVVKNYNSIQPFVLLKYVLERIATHFGFTWEGNFYDDPELANILIWNTSPLDYPQSYIGDKKFVFWKRSFSIKDLLPDMTVVEFLKAIQSRYNLAFYYNEGTNKVKISYREQIAKNINYDDITSLCSNVKTIENNRVDGYTLLVNKDDTDAFSSTEQFLVGTISTANIEIPCGRLFSSASVLIGSKVQSGPRVSQKMGSKGQFRIFHYSGIVDNVTYKYASANISGGDFDETLQALYDKNHKIWLFYQIKRLNVKVEAAFELRDLLKIDWELKRRFDRTNYIINAIEFTLTNKGITKSLVELFNF